MIHKALAERGRIAALSCLHYSGIPYEKLDWTVKDGLPARVSRPTSPETPLLLG